MYAKSYGRFRFDEVDLLTATGWTIRADFQGTAVVDAQGQIVELELRALSPKGERTTMVLHADDGDLFADLTRSLAREYADQIGEAAGDAYGQSRIRQYA